MTIVLTRFARGRLFEVAGRGTLLRGVTPEDFERHCNEQAPLAVLDGYADFCKLHVHRNWTETRCGTIPLNVDTAPFVRSAYEARTPEELPVLTRWIEGIEPPVAEYLLVILYSREQLLREGDPIDADWGVVGCLATMEPVETPLAPITMLRNALGVEEGGSGVPLDREKYLQSVEFWSRNANWRPTEGAGDQ